MKQVELPATGYAVIRCHDQTVVAMFDFFPEEGTERRYTFNEFTEFMERCGLCIAIKNDYRAS
jgi:hypothetical protein